VYRLCFRILSFLLIYVQGDRKVAVHLMIAIQNVTSTVFTRIICVLFFPSLAAEKSGCVKYTDFFCGGLDLGFILV
jgi:hypothetical protein